MRNNKIDATKECAQYAKITKKEVDKLISIYRKYVQNFQLNTIAGAAAATATDHEEWKQ